MPSIPELERRVHLAQEAVEAAYQARNPSSARLHGFRLDRALEALREERIRQGEM